MVLILVVISYNNPVLAYKHMYISHFFAAFVSFLNPQFLFIVVDQQKVDLRMSN